MDRSAGHSEMVTAIMEGVSDDGLSMEIEK
jgi:hypothetical protein